MPQTAPPDFPAHRQWRHPLPPDSTPVVSRKSHEKLMAKEKLCLGKSGRAFGLAIYTASMASLSAIASSEVNRCSTEKSLAKCWACSRLREYTAVNLYLPLSSAASTNWRVDQTGAKSSKIIITRRISIKGFCRQCGAPFIFDVRRYALFFRRTAMLTKRPNHDRWPEIFRLTMEDFCVNHRADASVSRS